MMFRSAILDPTQVLTSADVATFIASQGGATPTSTAILAFLGSESASQRALAAQGLIAAGVDPNLVSGALSTLTTSWSWWQFGLVGVLGLGLGVASSVFIKRRA